MASELALRHETRADPEALVLVVCGLTRHQRAYVSDGFRRARTRFVDGYEELDGLLSTLDRCDAFILAVEDAKGRNALATAERFKREWPRTPVVVFCPPRPQRPTWFANLTVAGVRGFVFEGVNDTAASLADAVDNARQECVAESVLERLEPLIPLTLHPLVLAVLGRPAELTTVEAVASHLNVHRKTLVNRCAKAGFPVPGELINWCRLAMVAEQLERTGATIESVALMLGFPSHTALRNLMKRYTGLTATQVRKGGGVMLVLEALRKELRLPIR